MNILVMVAAILCPLAAAGVFFLSFGLARSRRRARQFEVQHATLAAQLEALQRDADQLESLRFQNAEYLEQKSIAQTQRQEAERKLQAALAERDAFLRQKDEAQAQRAQAEQRLALMQQHVQDVEKRMQDWELQRAEFQKATTASVMEVGNKVSSKLLEDHKRETEAARKDAEETAKKNAQGLLEQMQTITHSVAALKEQTGQAQEKMATVWRALTTPAGVGHLAEIGLENSLKNMGLEPMRDYISQFALGASQGNVRPDAVIFLPQDMVMVIDSKASKYLLEIAEAEEKGTAQEELLRGLAQTMNKHLNDLRTKDYEAAIRAAYQESGRSRQISATHMVMYVPSEAAIAHLKRADSEFMQKAEKRGIIVASPASLFGLLSLAKHNIGLVRQSENHDLILKNVSQLMDHIVTMLGYAERVGKGIKSAADGFDQFSRSVNRNVLSKMRQLAGFGVKPAKSKEIPSRLSSFEVRVSEDMLTIEGEAERVGEPAVIEDLTKLSA